MAFVMALGLSAALTPLVRYLAFRIGAVDKPDARKVHLAPIPRIGGLAIAIAWLVPFLLYVPHTRQFLGLLAGVLILLGVGLYDDIKDLNAWYKLGWQVLAALVVLAGGIGIVYFSNPAGGIFALDFWRLPVHLGAIHFNILPIANFISVLWIVGIINTINFLDGLDGLAAGVSGIAALVLFLTALTPALANPLVALLAIALVGALVGFLPYNFFPASIFMGDSGAYVIGLILALLSIYGNSKVAIGALVLGIAIADALLTVVRRILRRQSPFKADRTHLHHQLLDSGTFSHRQVVLFLYLLTALLALALILFGGMAAFTLLLLILVAMVSLSRILARSRA
jgi:UDP-GlcNAc:undecaprenyl-phosphate GlcNAc-1-phosphate transferase